ncbi:hypothetical protein JCM17823_29800 [Halorubrum gandharaense]
MLQGALTTPTRTDDAAGVVVVGFVLTLLSWTLTPTWVLATIADLRFLIVAPLALAPLLLTRGYYVSVVADAVRTGNEAGAPSFVRWGRLYRDGVASLVLSAVLLAPLAAVLTLGFAALSFLRSGAVEPAAVVPDAVLADGISAGAVTEATVAVVAAFLVVFVAGYLVAFAVLRPAALARFAASGRLREGLRPGAVFRTAFTGDYVAGWTLAMVVLLAGYVVAAPFLGLFVGVAIVFVVRLVVHSLYGRAAATALGGSSGDAPSPADDRATHDEKPPETRATATVSGTPPAETDAEHPAAPPEVPPDVQTGRSVALRGSDILPPNAVAAADRESEGVDDADAGDGAGRGDPDAGDAIGGDFGPGDAGGAGESGFDWGPRTEDR